MPAICPQEDADFEARVKEVREFNARSAWRKRGIAITPVRYYTFTSFFYLPVACAADQM